MVMVMMMINYLMAQRFGRHPLSFLSRGSNWLGPAAKRPVPIPEDPEGVSGKGSSALRCSLLLEGVM